jgi:uncharacterized protein YukE
MARPTDWHVLDLDGDPTPGDVSSVQALAREFHDFADDVQRAWGRVSSLGTDQTALTWIGASADAFREQFGKFPDDLRKLFTSYRMAGDALEAYWPVLQRVQNTADKACWDAEGAHEDLARAAVTLTGAQQDLKNAQAAGAPTDAHVQAQTAAQGTVDAASGRIKTLKATTPPKPGSTTNTGGNTSARPSPTPPETSPESRARSPRLLAPWPRSLTSSPSPPRPSPVSM